MITAADSFISPPRIVRDDFVSAVVAAGSPVAAIAAIAYDKCAATGVDPLGLLALFNHESNMGLKGVAAITRSWGNMRNPPVGNVAYTVYVDPVKGSYLAFGNWLDGAIATAAHLASPLYAGLPIGDAIRKWAPVGDGANDPDVYVDSAIAFMNSHASFETTKGGSMRVIVQAGHENIGNISADKLGQASADSLRGATGANGEVAQNVATAQAVVNYLVNAGVDAVRVDAIDDAAWTQPADLAIAIHADGVGFGNTHAQWCGAAAVLSGQENADADAKAKRFVEKWKAVYPGLTGITDTHVDTNDMDYYYTGWYRTADTPLAIIECCIIGGSDGIRPDAPSPITAGFAVASAVLDWAKEEGFNVQGIGSPPVAPGVGIGPVEGTGSAGDDTAPANPPGSSDAVRVFADTGHKLANAFRRYYEDHGDVEIFGLPLTEEFGYSRDGALSTIQVFQRAVFEYHPDDPNGHEVQLALVGRDWLRGIAGRGEAPASSWLN